MNGIRFSGGTPVRGVRRTRDAQRETGELLLRLGVTPHTEGYAMLRDGARLIARCGRYRQIGMTNELYPLLAEGYRQRDGAAEHAVRDAIRLAWQREDPDRQALCCDGGTPSNAAFLYLLAGQMRRGRIPNG